MSWLRTIVDEQDRIIGYKDSKQINHPIDIYRVSALWLINKKHEVLLARRGFELKNSPGKWGPAVAGTVDKGETYISNIYKEADEEIGLRGIKFSLGPKRLVHEGGSRSYFCQWYTASVDYDLDRFTPDAREVASLKWMSMSKLLKDVQNNSNHYIPGFQNEVALFSPKSSK